MRAFAISVIGVDLRYGHSWRECPYSWQALHFVRCLSVVSWIAFNFPLMRFGGLFF